MTPTFRDSEVKRLRQSGWEVNPSIRALVADSGLPSPVEYAADALSDGQWAQAERTEAAMRETFADCRFAEVVEYGLLMVPSPSQLDTRGPMPTDVRASQHPGLGEDFLDPALGEGVDLSEPSSVWTPFVSVVGRYGFTAGSYEQIIAAPAERFEVNGFDTRTGMTRQLWGARLLQAEPGIIPDSDYNETWTFTLFPGEPLTDEQAASGTVLKGRVRFRLGKTNRGIGSVRLAPAAPTSRNAPYAASA